jgi:hypothetical protein
MLRFRGLLGGVEVAVTIYTRIRKTLGLNLSRDTGYRDGFFVVFLSPSRNISRQYFDTAIAAFFQIPSNSSYINQYIVACRPVDK